MKAAPYNEVFFVPVARKGRPAARQHNPNHIIDLEFSNEYRDPRFQPGWYILPGLAIMVVIIAFIV